MISTKPLESALPALKSGIDITESAKKDPATPIALRNLLQAGVIQHFEFWYELSWKTLKRKLAVVMPSPEILDTLSYQGLIREGAQKGYIADAEKWM